MLFTKKATLERVYVVLFSVVGILLLAQNVSWAATISCDTPGICKGTNEDDVINDGNDGQIIDELDGDDVINSGGGNDDVCGGPGNDRIHLGGGDDRAWGDGLICKGQSMSAGADRINGGPGNDILAHGLAWDTDSDGFKDILDCGPSDDIALLNITIDHDEATNCEHINPYP